METYDDLLIPPLKLPSPTGSTGEAKRGGAETGGTKGRFNDIVRGAALGWVQFASHRACLGALTTNPCRVVQEQPCLEILAATHVPRRKASV